MLLAYYISNSVTAALRAYEARSVCLCCVYNTQRQIVQCFARHTDSTIIWWEMCVCVVCVFVGYYCVGWPYFCEIAGRPVSFNKIGGEWNYIVCRVLCARIYIQIEKEMKNWSLVFGGSVVLANMWTEEMESVTLELFRLFFPHCCRYHRLPFKISHALTNVQH